MSGHLSHSGVKGQKKGIRHYQSYEVKPTRSGMVGVYLGETPVGRSKKETSTEDVKEKVKSGDKKINKALETVGSALISQHDIEWEEMFNLKNNPYLEKMIDGKTTFPISWQGNSNTGERWISPTDAVHEQVNRDEQKNGKREMDWDSVTNSWDKVKHGTINPDYGAPGTKQNCAKCSFLTELYTRGIGLIPGMGDVSAGRQTDPSYIDWCEKWFVGAKRERYNNAKDASDEIDSYGDKSSGTLNVQSTDGAFGHALHWTKMKSTVAIEDGQNGTVYDGDDFEEAFGNYIKHNSWFTDSNFSMTRLDNCEVNWDAAMEDGVIRGDSVWNHRTKKIVSTW